MLLILLFYFLYSYSKEIELVGQQYKVEPFKFLDPPLVLEFSEGIKMLRAVDIEIGDEDDLSTPNEKLLGRLVKAKVIAPFFVCYYSPNKMFFLLYHT